MSDLKGFTNTASAGCTGAVNSVPKGWTSAELSDFCDTVGGGTPDRSVEEYWNGEIPWASPTEITTRHSKYISKTKESITLKGLEKSSAKLHPPGTVLMTSRASIGYVAINTVPMATNQGFQSLRCKKNALADYIYQYITWIRPELERMSAGSTFSEISSSSVKRLRATLPPLSEQKKIAAILSSVDEVIEKTRAQIDKLKDLKAGMMQELLTKGIGHTEFKDSPVGRIPVRWDCVLLEEVAAVQTGVAKNSNSKGDMISVPYLRVANVQDGYLNLTEIKYIEIDKGRLSRFSLQPDDVLVNEGGDFDKIGRGAIWKGLISPCVHQNHVFVVRTMKDQLLPEFFNYLSGSQYGKSYYLGCAKQTTNLASLNSSQLKMFPVLLPSIAEQECICKNLGAIDQKQRLLEEKLAGKINIKRALMQDLLTGKVRVQVEARELAEA
ncbi:restriction endonuclease subunit S [Vreelandella andesensis]|uniref:Restriction endonuclease subunit S n=1 Tax=Vreelandella andesensis TaxID=447567 RepID=A0A433KWI2_9GAMM|nr:restriction endonuclease subunit S [Halomonas andesensis]RUR34069.1 restriction endonuclease subunit S [Halomonas andesensis]